MIAVRPGGDTIAARHGREMRLWQISAPVIDNVAKLRTEIEAATGLTLTESRAIERLSAEEWRKRQDTLKNRP
jgi:hypothetical protein